jgi:hypothetical protein
MLVVTQNGNAYNKNGRRFPYFPGFLLSIMTPKTIEKNAEINMLKEPPIEASKGSKLIV